MSSRVMVVDDSSFVLRMVAGLLGGEGYEVLTVNSPFGLQSAMKEFRPSLVLMDLDIPGLRGDRIAEIMKGKQMGFDYKVAFYSSEDEATLAEAVRRTGAAGYIRKGDGVEEFKRAVAAFIASVHDEQNPPDAEDTLRRAVL
jgi:CheY-like chemotaxis protein